MFCTNCGKNIEDTAKFCTGCGTPVGAVAPAAPAVEYTAPVVQETSTVGMDFDFETNTATPSTQKRYAYKVLSQKDKWFSGKFDPMVLEQAINAYAQQGWRFVGCATADIPGLGVTRQEFVAILEREA